MRPSRRAFVSDAVVAAAAVGAFLTPDVARAASALNDNPAPPTAWDLSWLRKLNDATDRALFDWPILGNPADPQHLWFAERYLDGCNAVYGTSTYRATVVLNIRTQAVPAALDDTLWERYALGVEYKTNDPFSSKPVTQNPFWHAGPEPAPGVGTTSLAKFVERGAIILVCDFALGHLAKRLAASVHRGEVEVHAELRSGLVPGAYAVPSGIFGMAKAQNGGVRADEAVKRVAR